MLNKKVLLSVLIIGTIAIVAGAGTWAWFTDTQYSNGNTFTAGTLGLSVGDQTGTNIGKFTFNNIAPGFDKTETVNVKNTGTIDGNLFVTIKDLQLSGVDPQLQNVLNVEIYAGSSQVASGKLASITNVKYPAGTLYGIGSTAGTSTSADLTYKFTIDGASVGNEIQGDGVIFNVQYDLEQVHS